MKVFHITFTVDELQHLSMALNNELTLQQPNIFKNVYISAGRLDNPKAVAELSKCVIELMREVAMRIMNRYNSLLQNGRKKGSVGFTKAEAHAINICNRYGGFNHLELYEFNLFYRVIQNSDQLTLD